MLSQKQADVDPETEAGLKEPGTSSGAVTPSGCVNGDGSREFLSTGRTGRRNAMPDILGEHMETGTADLPDKFESLSTDQQDQQSTIVRNQGEPSSSSSQGESSQQNKG